MPRPTKTSPRALTARPLARRHWALVLATAAALLVLGTSYRMYDPDVWQHLLVGRAIWTLHAVPATNLWTWPTYGAPYVLPSWLFRALLWPLYALGGVAALAGWRWLTTLAAFGIAWATARRMGARGLVAVLAVTWCGLLYRQRSMVRPETLVAVLLAVQMWILETRRQGGRDHSPWLVPIAWTWANVHVSYYVPLLLTGVHVLDDAIAAVRRRPGAAWPLRLAAVLAASAALCVVNPFGMRALAQPFQYWFEWRHQPLYRMIYELKPIAWEAHARDGLAAWVVLAPALFLVRVLRGRGTLADALTWAFFLATALSSQRFLGFLAVAGAPLFARDASDALAGVRPPGPLRPAWARASLASIVLVAGALPQLAQAPLQPGFGIAWEALPVRACDWIGANGVRGPCFGPFHFAGYQLLRFWPQRDRLPFMDIHQTGTRDDQDLYARCWSSAAAWAELDRRHRFEWVLLPRASYPGQDLLDRLDADTLAWSLVFADDAAALYLRRDGRLAPLAERRRYRIMPAGEAALLRAQAAIDSAGPGRAQLRAELERQVRESEWTWRAHSGLASIALAERRWPQALEELRRTRALNPDAPLLLAREQAARAGLAARP